MKYWKCSFTSYKKHPDGEKEVVLYVANKKKGEATTEAKKMLLNVAYEGENGSLFKAPVMEETTQEEYDAFFADELIDSESDFDGNFDFDGDQDEGEGDQDECDEESEAVTEDDIVSFTYAVALFGKKDGYEDHELEQIGAAMEGDISPEELAAVELVTALSIKAIGKDLHLMTLDDAVEVIATIDSERLKSKLDEGRMFEAGCRVARKIATKHHSENIEKLVNRDFSEPRQETSKITVPAPFELFIRVFSIGDKFKSAFMTKTEGKVTYSDVNAVFDKDFDKKENAITWAIGTAIDWFNAIASDEGHLQASAAGASERLSSLGSARGNIIKIFESGHINGGAIDESELTEYIDMITKNESSDDDEDFDFDDDFDLDDDFDFDDEPKVNKESDIDDHLEIDDEPEPEPEKIERTDQSVIDADIEKFDETVKGDEFTLEDINEIVNNLKPGEHFAMDNIPEHIYRQSDGMSNSSLKMFNEDASSLEWIKRCPVDEDRIKPLNLGRAVHTGLLEPELYESTYVTAPSIGNKPQDAQIDKYSKWVKAGRDENSKDKPTPTTIEKMDKITAFESEVNKSGLTVLTKDEQKQIYLMVGSVNAHPTAEYFFDNVIYTEFSIWWISEASGVLCKARVDAIACIDGEYIALDVKTTGNFKDFGKSAYEFGYHRQDAHYTEAMNIAFEQKETKFLFIVVSSSIMLGRYPGTVKELKESEKLIGREEVDADLKEYKQRLDSGNFVSIGEIERPRWAKK